MRRLRTVDQNPSAKRGGKHHISSNPIVATYYRELHNIIPPYQTIM